MKNDKIKTINAWFFIVPLVVLVFIFTVYIFFESNKSIRKSYEIIENYTSQISESYTRHIAVSRAASEIITELLNEKLIIAGTTVSLTADKYDNEALAKIAKELKVDEIYLYNQQGYIINSSNGQYIGWKAYEGHPVYNFMVGESDSLIEDIRQDTESERFLKYAYIKGKNHFVQVGVLAEKVQAFLNRFEIQQMLDELTKETNVQQIIFIDLDTNIIVNNSKLNTEKLLQDKNFIEHIEQNYSQVERFVLDGNDYLHMCKPVLYNNEKIGTLALFWSPEIIDIEIRSTISNSIVAFFIFTFILGSLLYYAYRKNKLNNKIAYYDKVTGIPNEDYLHEYLERKINEDDQLAILFLDISNLELINLTYGYKHGNEILKQIVSRINNAIDLNTKCFRLNSSKLAFVVKKYNSQKDLENLANELLKAIKTPTNQDIDQIIIAKIAILEVNDKNKIFDQIMLDTALALNSIEEDNNRNIVFYNEKMEALIHREDKIEKTLQNIIKEKDTNSLYLVFQPKLNIKTNKIIGFEALARMQIEELGNVSPLEFIAVAEKHKLIYDLGNIILKKAIKFLIDVKDAGFENTGMAINISGIQLLRDNFLDDVKDIIETSGIDKSLLEFELTESVFMDNFEIVNAKLAQIKKMNISISLDDFGTGYSSFSRLRDLNIDSIKIDKSFIDRVTEHSDDDLISADIISMAHKLHLTVVAEGVENEIQKTYLIKNDCDIIQGYLLSKPLIQTDALDFLRNY